MFLRAFYPDAFLPAVHDTPPFAAFCAARGIRYRRPADAADGAAAERVWADATARLSPDERATANDELAAVNDLGRVAGVAALAAAVDADPPATLPDGPALALWYFTRHPEPTRRVLLGFEPPDGDVWRFARTAPALLSLDPPDAGLRDRYAAAVEAATGASWVTAEAFVRHESVALLARIPARTRSVPAFVRGVPVRQPYRPARRLLVQYRPADGRVLVCGPLTPAEWDRLPAALADVFAASVEPTPVALRLDRLLEPGVTTADAPDLSARARAVHLSYPAADGGRLVKLETRLGDADDALDRLLAAHVPAEHRAGLTVCHAAVELRVTTRFGVRPLPLKLWPDRATLLHPDAGPRVLRLLARWGVLPDRP